MSFKVTKQYARGTETTLKQFNTLQEAQAFLKDALAYDRLMKTTVVYRLYDMFDLLEEHDASQEEAVQSKASNDTQAGQGKSAGFRPTPLNTALRPSGFPPKWALDDDEKKKDK